MAKIIHNSNTRMTAGEKSLYRMLETLLDDNYFCYHDIPVGKNSCYPDFIILHPKRGLLFLEVKDWHLKSIKKITKNNVSLLTKNGEVCVSNPIEQVRQCAFQVIDQLAADKKLILTYGNYKGKLKIPYSYGVIFTKIKRDDLNKLLTLEGGSILPERQVICKDEITENTDSKTFQNQLFKMLIHTFPHSLSQAEIDRIRWILYPEIRIPVQEDLFIDSDENKNDLNSNTKNPEIIKVMDLQQEQLARNLGSGHRIIHGVAGSGKTMILKFRALWLSQRINKPILVLCFNKALAGDLEYYIKRNKVEDKVKVYHFHAWCKYQIDKYKCNLPKDDLKIYEKQVVAVINGLKKQQIPKAQYGAVLIDEGHDFEPEWLKIVTQIIDPESDSFLLLYDDAQSIYTNKIKSDFSLLSVGIKARGRTTILRLNYRNTQEIIQLAYNILKNFIPKNIITDDDHIPTIVPKSAGLSGNNPLFAQFEKEYEELEFIKNHITKCLKSVPKTNSLAILVPTKKKAQNIYDFLDKNGVENLFLKIKENKSKNYANKYLVTILTIHSSKGLEFDNVIVAGIETIENFKYIELMEKVKLLYVGMTRAKLSLLITSCKQTELTQCIADSIAS